MAVTFMAEPTATRAFGELPFRDGGRSPEPMAAIAHAAARNAVNSGRVDIRRSASVVSMRTSGPVATYAEPELDSNPYFA